VIEAGDKVDALDMAPVGMVVMPADDLILIRVGLFGNAVIDNHDAVFALHLADMRLDQKPSIGRGPLWPGQEALHPVVTDGSEKEGGQAGGRRLSEGARQIVAVQVKEFVVFHTPILPQTA
jgi:hypothetical protein